jgi:hypothetical protein
LPPVTGQFTGNRGEFFDQEDFKGRAILVRYLWLNISPESARMEQSFSPDGGKTWEIFALTRTALLLGAELFAAFAVSCLGLCQGGNMSSTRNPGRVAGFLYLLLVVFAPFRLIYIPTKLFVHGDATATASNISAHELLFRLGILSDLLCGTVLIFLVLALYRLLKGVDQNLAVLMVILGGVMPAIIDFLNVLNDAAALMLVRGADFLSAFEKPQRDALAMMFLRLHHQEILAAEILWGLWLFPLAILVYRSRSLPRFLGVWLIINGFAYLTISFTGLLLPQYEDMVSNIAFPALLGEMAIMLWLLIKGAKPQSLDAATALPAAG